MASSSVTKTADRVGQRFQVGDRVQEANAFGKGKDSFHRRKGTVQSVTTKKNSRGHENFYYDVLWDGHQHPTNRIQHRLSSIQ